MQFLTPGILLISACVAIWAVVSNRKAVRRRATLDLIEKSESTHYYQDLSETFSYYKRNNALLALQSREDPKDRDDKQKIIDYLNHYELLCIGILKGFVDEQVYYSWMATPLVADWNAAAPYIQRQRWKYVNPNSESNPTNSQSTDGCHWLYAERIWANFQTVAEKWSDEAINLHSNLEGMGPPDEPEGIGDQRIPIVQPLESKSVLARMRQFLSSSNRQFYTDGKN